MGKLDQLRIKSRYVYCVCLTKTKLLKCMLGKTCSSITYGIELLQTGLTAPNNATAVRIAAECTRPTGLKQAETLNTCSKLLSICTFFACQNSKVRVCIAPHGLAAVKGVACFREMRRTNEKRWHEVSSQLPPPLSLTSRPMPIQHVEWAGRKKRKAKKPTMSACWIRPVE